MTKNKALALEGKSEQKVLDYINSFEVFLVGASIKRKFFYFEETGTKGWKTYLNEGEKISSVLIMREDQVFKKELFKEPLWEPYFPKQLTQFLQR